MTVAQYLLLSLLTGVVWIAGGIAVGYTRIRRRLRRGDTPR